MARHGKGGIGGFLSGLRLTFSPNKPGSHSYANPGRWAQRGPRYQGQRGRTGARATLAARPKYQNPSVFVGAKQGRPYARTLSQSYWR